MLLPDWAFVSRGIEIPTIFAWARGVLIAIPTLLGDGGVGEAVGGLYIKASNRVQLLWLVCSSVGVAVVG